MRETDIKCVLECSVVTNGYGASEDACLSGCVFRAGRWVEPEQIPEGGWEGRQKPCLYGGSRSTDQALGAGALGAAHPVGPAQGLLYATAIKSHERP